MRKKMKVTYMQPVKGLTPRAGFGNRTRVNMVYCERIQFGGATLGTASVYQFSTSSIFDPNVTGVGHQPTTHDQLSPLFEQYCVTSVKYKVVFLNTTTLTAFVGVQISDNSSVTSDPTLLVEQGQADYKPLQVTTGFGTATFEGYVDNPKLMGKDFKEYLNGTSYNARFGNNPADPGYINLFVTSADGTTAPNVQAFVRLEYTVYVMGSSSIPQS